MIAPFFAGNYTGAGLVAAGAGVRGTKKLIEHIPQVKVKRLLTAAVENPDMMADLLAKPRSAQHQKEIYGRIYAFMPSLFVNTQVPHLDITLKRSEDNVAPVGLLKGVK